MLTLPRLLSASSRTGALAAAALSLGLVLGGLPAAAAPQSTPGTTVAVAPSRSALASEPPASRALLDRADASTPVVSSDRASVAAAFRDVYLPAVDVAAPDPDPASVAACDAGRSTAELQAATFQLVNYFRAMSQVEPVTEDPALSAKAQQAALMMHANGQLSHDPPTDWACYSPEGADAAGHANLALGYQGADAIRGYMDDTGRGNVEAGHRWWLQRPAARTMGSGAVGRAQALWVVTDEPAVPEPIYTSWPSAGFFPRQLDPAGRWSFTATNPSYDLSSASVTITDGQGQPVPATAYPVGAFGSLVFEVGELPQPGTGVQDYRVTISNISVDGAPIAPYAYTVSIFDPLAEEEPIALVPTSEVTLSGVARMGQTLTAAGPSWSEPGVQTTYRWFRDGAPIPGALADQLVLGAADAGRRISVEATGTKAGFAPITVTSAQTAPVAKLTATLTLTGRSTSIGNLQIDAVIATTEPVPGGTVTVREGSALVGSPALVTDGRAAFRASRQRPGSHTYTVTYSGSARIQSTSTTVKVTVLAKTPGTLTLVGSSPAVGRARIKISVAAVGEGLLTGKASVKEGSKLLRTLAVKQGRATFEGSKIKPGRHTYTVRFGGTSRVAAVTRSVSVQVKAKTASTTSLTGSSPAANQIRIKIAVAAPGQSALGGTAKVQEGSKTIKAGLKISGGKATFTASGIKPGRRTFKVTYSGTSEVKGSSKSVTIDVKKPVTLTSYADCSALRVDYPHGVGRTDATDQTSGTPVTNFFRHNALYSYNDGADRRPGEKDLDRDNDGIACESH